MSSFKPAFSHWSRATYQLPSSEQGASEGSGPGNPCQKEVEGRILEAGDLKESHRGLSWAGKVSAVDRDLKVPTKLILRGRANKAHSKRKSYWCCPAVTRSVGRKLQWFWRLSGMRSGPVLLVPQVPESQRSVRPGLPLCFPRIPDWERGVWLDAGRSHLPPRLNGGSCETAERKGSVRPVGRSRNTVWAPPEAPQHPCPAVSGDTPVSL